MAAAATGCQAGDGAAVAQFEAEDERGPRDADCDSLTLPQALQAVRSQSYTKQRQGDLRKELQELLEKDAAEAAKDKLEERQYLHDISKSFVKLRHTTESLRTDRDLLHKVVKEHKDGWRLLKNAAPELRKDRELLLAAVKSSAAGWKAMLTAPPELREDWDIAAEAVRRNAAALECLAPSLRQDSQLVSEALTSLSRRLRNQLKSNDGETKVVRPAAFVDKVVQQRGHDRAFLLEHQLQQGYGTVKQDDDQPDNLVRQLQIVTLWIRDQNSGFVLIILGRYLDGNNLVPKLMLPGKTMRDGSQPSDVCSSFLAGDFFRLKSCLEVSPIFETSGQEETSPSLGLHTVYRRVIFKATFQGFVHWKKASAKITKFRSPMAVPSSQRLARRHHHEAGSARPPLPPEMYTLRAAEGRVPPSQNVDVYAWLPVWEYEWLSKTDAGRQALEDWMAQIDMDAHLFSLQEGSHMSSLLKSCCVSSTRNFSSSDRPRTCDLKPSSPRTPSRSLEMGPSLFVRLPGTPRRGAPSGVPAGGARSRPDTGPMPMLPMSPRARH